jgi:hypothetical protein
MSSGNRLVRVLVEDCTKEPKSSYWKKMKQESKRVFCFAKTTKERGATILMTSSMVDSLNPMAGAFALAAASKNTLDPGIAQLPAAA